MGTIEYLVESTASQALPERMQELYAAGELMDTTLVCKNGSVRAHKVVMAAQSKFLEDVLVQHPCKSPVIVLLDLEIDTLRCLVDYMYHGKVAIKAAILEDFIKAANVLRLMSVIRGLDDETSDTGGGGQAGIGTAPLLACGKTESSTFDAAGTTHQCHVAEVNNFAGTTTHEGTTVGATGADTGQANAQMEATEVISDGQELVQVQSLEGHVPEDSFVTDDLGVAISSESTTPLSSTHVTSQHHPSPLRTIVISSRANFDQRAGTQRLFSQRPLERTLTRINQSKRRRFDVVALRSRPSTGSVCSALVPTMAASHGIAELPPPSAGTGSSGGGGGGAGAGPGGSSNGSGGGLGSSSSGIGGGSGGTLALCAPGSQPTAGGIGGGGGGDGGTALAIMGVGPPSTAPSNGARKGEVMARIESGLIGAEQRDGAESLDELVGVHYQMIVDGSGARMHQCLLCPQTTAFPSNMKRHIMGHLGIKPYKCTHCDFQSTLRGDLNVHMRKKHPGEDADQSIIISMK